MSTVGPQLDTTGIVRGTDDQAGDVRGVAEATKKRLTSPWASLAAVVLAVVWTVPTLGLFISSFRPAADINKSGWWTVFTNPNFTLENYQTVLSSDSSSSLAPYIINSIVITIPAVLIPLLIASLAAYGFAWMDFKFKNVLFVAVFALQIVPIQMALVPLLSLFSRGLEIGDVQIFPGLEMREVDHSFATVWIAHVIFAMPLAIFLLHNFIAEIPSDVIEAARVDGAGHGQIFFRIILPLATPALASFAILEFIWVWNDLLVATIFAPTTSLPMTQTLNSLSGTWGNQWFLVSAGAFLVLFVPIIVFLALQRFFVRGLMAGATKG